MVKRVAEDPFYYCVDAIFMMVSVPNNLNIQFSTMAYDESETKNTHSIRRLSAPKLYDRTMANSTLQFAM